MTTHTTKHSAKGRPEMRRTPNKTSSRTLCLAAAAATLAAACSTTGSLGRNDVLRHYDSVARLDNGVTNARARNAPLLAPQQFARVERDLNSAIDAGKRADKIEAQAAADKGLKELSTLDENMERNRGVLEEVMTTRARAERHGAASLFEEEFVDTDKDLREVAILLEKREQKEAAERRPDLISRYAALELKALQEGLIAAAEGTISRADEDGAGEYAPTTLAEARQELSLARSVLKADRTQIEKSNRHANEAIWLARRAFELTSLARAFEQADSSREDVLLWHQAQLQQVRDASRPTRLPFDRPVGEVIAALRSDVTSLMQTTQDLRRANRLGQERYESLQARMDVAANQHRAELEALLATHQTELAAMRGGNRAELRKAELEAARQVTDLQARLSEKAKQLERETRREFEAQARFEHVRALFEARDADVFRKGQNLLIRLKGFQFRPGESQIEARNFALLNNVVSAIGIFPQAKVVVSGHTDSTGNAKTNLKLSRTRAESVAEFLSTMGGVAASKLTVEGHGEDEPVSSNDTSEGRAQNRRIDISIINQGAAMSGPRADGAE